MIAAFDDPRLDREFSPNSWTRGKRYFRDGHVGGVHWVDAAKAWHALVQGNADQPYEVVLRVWHDGAAQLSGTCTCPAPSPCKHQAAVLCALREHRPVAEDAPAARVRARSRRDLGAEPGEDLGALRSWADAISRAEPLPQPGPRTSKRLVYVVNPRASFAGAPSRVVVDARSVFVRKSGELGKSAPYDMRFAVSGYGEVAKYVSDDDRLLWYRLTRLRGDFRFASASEPAFGRDADATALFADFVTTGRCYLADTGTPALRMSEPRRASVQWVTDDAGRQRLAVMMTVERPDRADETVEADALLPLSPLHYVETHTGKTGPLQFDFPERLADALADLPVLEPETVAQLPSDLAERLDEFGLPRPTARPVAWQPDCPPTPRLWLGVDADRDPGPDGLAHARAVVSFDYGPVRVEFGPAYDDNDVDAALVVGLQVLKAVRDIDEESRRLSRLETLGLAIGSDPVGVALAAGLSWAWFCDHAVPELRRDGWTVDIEPDFPVQAIGDAEWYMELSPSDTDTPRADWFSLELGVDVDGVRVNLLPAVVDAIRSGRIVRDRIALDAGEIPLRLADGRWISLPSERLAIIVDTLVELFDDKLVDGRLPLSAADSGRLLGLEGFAWHGDSSLRTLAEQLTGTTPLPPVPAPAGLQTELRDYQLAGLQWLGLLREHGFGGVLADDMGLGKTVQTLAHLLVEKQAGRLDRPCLVVAPRTVLRNWLRECERFAPDLRCAVFHGPERDALLEGELPDLVVTTYALLHRDERLCGRQWHVVVLDEAQAIKNPQTAAARAARTLDARQRLCLTGTPMENHLEELWSLLSFSTPGLLGNRREFARNYRSPIERQGDARRFAALSARVAPFLLRRTKAQVLSELPPKTEVVLSVPLGPKQRDLYESVRMTMEKRVRTALRERGLARSQIVVLDALLKLRQVCCHPSLVKTEAARRSEASSAKTERLMELLTELLAAGRRAIVFSQFTSMLDVIGDNLDAVGVEHRRITGKTRKRQPVVDAFQAGEFPIL
ncbi:MAG: SNF2-related protein, partial [Myxococcota bacterium]